jgi:hypothetical protein
MIVCRHHSLTKLFSTAISNFKNNTSPPVPPTPSSGGRILCSMTDSSGERCSDTCLVYRTALLFYPLPHHKKIGKGLAKKKIFGIKPKDMDPHFKKKETQIYFQLFSFLKVHSTSLCIFEYSTISFIFGLVCHSTVSSRKTRP